MVRFPIADSKRPTTVTTWPITCALAIDWSFHRTPVTNCKSYIHFVCGVCVCVCVCVHVCVCVCVCPPLHAWSSKCMLKFGSE